MKGGVGKEPAFAGERCKFAVEGIRSAFREESSELAVNSFIGQVIRDEKNAGGAALDCQQFEIIPVEGQDETSFRLRKLIDIWIRHAGDMEIIPQMFQVIAAIEPGELYAGRHVLIQQQLKFVKPFWHGACV